MEHKETFNLKVADSVISISEEQFDHLTLIAYNARIEIEKHIRKRYQKDSDGELEIIDSTIILTEGDLLYIFKCEFE